MAVDNPSYFSLSGGGSLTQNCEKNLEHGETSSKRVAGPIIGTSIGSVGPATNGNPRTFAAFFRKRTVCTSMGVTTSSSSVISSSTTSTLTHHDSDRSIASSSMTTTTGNEEISPIHAKQQNQSNNNNNSGRKSFRSLFRSISANTENERTRQILKGDPRPSDVAPPSPYLPHRSHSHSEKDRRQRPMRRRVLKSASELLSNDMIYCGLPGDENADRLEGNCRRRRRHRHCANGMRNLNDEEEDCDDDDDDDDSENAEVFLGIDDARYYNLSALQPCQGITETGPRRHSIGTFLGGKEQQRGTINSGGTNLTTFSINPARIRVQTEGFIREPDEMAPPVPTIDQIDGPEIRDDKRDNRRCRKHRSGSRKGSRGRTAAATPSKIEPASNAFNPEDRDDVVFVSSKESEASALWVNYLTACFEQISRQQGRPPFRVRHVTVEDTIATSTTMHEKIGNSRLQIVVVCPGLLERVTTRPEQASTLARQLSPERVLAMMLGVHDGHLTENHRAALINYSLWRKFFVKDQDETFVGEFLGAAVAILGTTPSPTLRNDKTTFSVHPKKVKLGQNRVMIIFNDPLRSEDTTTVIVDRCGEAIEITHVKRRNPYVLQFSIPDRCLEVSMLVGVRVMINGSPQGVKQVKCESRLRELDQILRAHDNPLEFMCQTFGFNPGDREQLDNWMVNAFQKNVPPRFDLLSTPSGSAPLQRNQTSPEEYPTLLHFAARFGLEKLAWQLLECPGGDVACDLRNVSELTPADLADQSSHTRLAHQLRGYMQMNEFTNMYSYLKVISESTSNPGAANESAPSSIACGNSVCSENEHDKEDYCRPRPLSEAYSIPPAARPITVSTSMNFTIPPQLPPPNPTISSNTCDINYSVLPPPTPINGPSRTPTPCSNANGLDLPLQGYLKMHPACPKTPSPTGGPSTNALTASMISLRSQLACQSTASLRREDGATTPCSVVTRQVSNSGGKSRENSGPQDELLEIINDFKNNVFTISEVERLVENWRNRNDVQQSFKDKQRQLTAMRDEYERIQRRIKDEMKAPTPFDKIKKFFTKTKKDSKDSSSQGGEDATTTTSTMSKTDSSSASGNLADRRPMSSLSLHSVSSSSSSGRMSIISGCSGTSLGDSGTHSDTEDRRVLRNSREDKGGVMNYEIPPAPKPFAGRFSPMRYTPSPRSSSTSNETDNRRTTTPCAQPGESEYYIAFPVSGLPIHSFQSNGAPIEPKTPNSPCDHPVYLDLTDKVNEIPEVSEKIEAELGHLTESKVPMPPSPPGMCIPFDYVNVTPTKETGNDFEKSTTTETRLINENSISTSCGATPNDNDQTTVIEIDQNSIILPSNETTSENSRITRDNSNDVAGNSMEYVSTDIIEDNNSACCDVTDSPRLPEYMNIAAPSDQEIARIGAGLPKKMPAPPVPPRGDSSLGR